MNQQELNKIQKKARIILLWGILIFVLTIIILINYV
jgi:hypothetical protein